MNEPVEQLGSTRSEVHMLLYSLSFFFLPVLVCSSARKLHFSNYWDGLLGAYLPEYEFCVCISGSETTKYVGFQEQLAKNFFFLMNNW